jgi:uncharacterized alpha-E superfamily protein
MSAYQSFRQEVQGIIRRENVLDFLMKNRRFPRSFAHCVCEVKSCLSNIPRSKGLVEQVNKILHNIDRLNIEKIHDGSLYLLIDEMQIELAELNQLITRSYFSLERKHHKQKQKQLAKA